MTKISHISQIKYLANIYYSKFKHNFNLLIWLNNGIGKVTSFIYGTPSFREYICWIDHLFCAMNLSTNWEFHRQDKEKILWIHICSEDLPGVTISINRWWKTRYPSYKIRIVSKTVFERVKLKK